MSDFKANDYLLQSHDSLHNFTPDSRNSRQAGILGVMNGS